MDWRSERLRLNSKLGTTETPRVLRPSQGRAAIVWKDGLHMTRRLDLALSENSLSRM
jgi:hypothetical protein